MTPRKPAIKIVGRGTGRALGKPCAYCGTAMTTRGSAGDFPTRDHVIPKSKGGKRSGTVWCCSDCNCAKASLLPAEFYELCLALCRGMVHFAKKRWGWYELKAKAVVSRHTMQSMIELQHGALSSRSASYSTFRTWTLSIIAEKGGRVDKLTAEEERCIDPTNGKPPECAERIIELQREETP